MSALSRFRLLVLLSFRNLFSHWVKTLIVGAIIAFGTLLVVTGTALNDSIERAMAEGITGSLAGHLQVYSAKAKDDLALFGGMFMGAEDVGRIDDYSAVRDVIQSVDGVKAVLPMGIDMATTTSQGELERSLSALRAAIRENKVSEVEPLRLQIREILGQLRDELEKNRAIAADKAKKTEEIATVDHALSDAFWIEFEADPLAGLEYLDTKVGPLTEEGRMMYFRYVGTDIEMFEQNFDRFEVVEGEAVPPGHRGFMFNKKFREDWVKHFVARNFDKIHLAVTATGKTITDDPALQALARQLAKQYRRVTYQLTPEESVTLVTELRTILDRTDGTIDTLLTDFLTVNDANFMDRYAFFYEKIAPKIDLYDLDVGEMITLRAYTRSGFLKSVNVKVYGVFQFRGLETSDIAGGHNLIDLLTFRELYGLMTEAKKRELDGIRAEIGLKDVSADDAEAALFGGDDAVVETVERPAGFDEFENVDLSSERERIAAMVNATFDKEAQDHGLALNAAVILDDPKQLLPMRTAVEAALSKAGFEMKVVDWQAASGIVGQFVLLIRGALYIAIFIIFAVALIIINNSMVMATMERVTEIGTMRAIGAPRSTVLGMVFLETLVLGVVAGALGMMFGAALIGWLGSVGIPAPSPELTFLFGGPRLFPTIGTANLTLGLVIILIVSFLSTLYPAYLTLQIQPIMAMRAKD